MRRLSNSRMAQVGAVLVFLVVVGLLLGLALRSKSAQGFYVSPPQGVTLKCLGSATNYLRFDSGGSWKAFSVSNGPSKTFVYTVTRMDCRTADGWQSNSPVSGSLRTHRETSGEVSSGSSDTFYASVTSNIPWRIDVGFWEASWHDPLDNSVSKVARKIQRLPPSNDKTWSGRKYHLTSAEITP